LTERKNAKEKQLDLLREKVRQTTVLFSGLAPTSACPVPPSKSCASNRQAAARVELGPPKRFLHAGPLDKSEDLPFYEKKTKPATSAVRRGGSAQRG